MKVSVVLPTYNEAGNIVSLVENILNIIPIDIKPEVIIVDDDSPDNTYEIALKAFSLNPAVKVFLRTKDRGLAKSIRYGIEHASGDSVVVMDTDFTHNPAEIPRLLHVGEMYDMVSGSRFCVGGNMEGKAHYLASFVYNLMLRVILRTQVQDNLGGFFIMNRKKLLSLPLDKIFFGYGDYFFRLIYLVERRGYTIIEVPAFYEIRSRGKSKSNFLKMFYKYSWSALKFVGSRNIR